MLSYRHGFHAGNFADVLKHLTLIALLNYLRQKDKPFCYIDTHAGAGLYKVYSSFMQKNQEFNQGIVLLMQQPSPLPLIQQYLTLVNGFNTLGEFATYPGSPSIAATLLREQDRMQCLELHPSDFALLSKLFAKQRQIKVFPYNAFEQLLGLLPPKEKRGLIFIDPAYELKNEYILVTDLVIKAYERFNTGVYALWYPVVKREITEQLIKKITRQIPNSLRIELCVKPDANEGGMTGSGMLILNPPFNLQATLAEPLSYLKTVLNC